METLLSHLTGANRERAKETLTNIIDALAVLYFRHGNPFGVDLRTLAQSSGVNVKRVAKWIDRLVASGHLTVESKGHWQGNTNTYSFTVGGVHSLLSNFQLQGIDFLTHCQNTKRPDPQNTMSEHTESCSDLNQCVNESITCCAATTIYKSVPHLSYTLNDLPDLGSDSVLPKTQNSFVSTVKGKSSIASKSKAKENSRLGEYLVKQMWKQCQDEKKRNGEYQYPIHPDVYWILTQSDNVEDDLHAKCFDDGKLLPRYRWLYQPPKETRQKCPQCLQDGAHRTLIIRMLTNTKFGAVRYYCIRCNKHFDLWKDFPVWQDGRVAVEA